MVYFGNQTRETTPGTAWNADTNKTVEKIMNDVTANLDTINTDFATISHIDTQATVPTVSANLSRVWFIHEKTARRVLGGDVFVNAPRN